MIQPLAYIHPEAKIAETVVIEPFVTIYKDVVIGEGTWIGSNVTIMDGARIGKNCRIFPGAVVSAPPQDLKYKGEPSTVTIRASFVKAFGLTQNSNVYEPLPKFKFNVPVNAETI